jgi:hypothetical protein
MPGMTLCNCTYTPALARASSRHSLGLGISLGSMASSSGRIFAPASFGYLFENYSHELPYQIGMVLALIGGLCYLVYHQRDLSQGEQYQRLAEREESHKERNEREKLATEALHAKLNDILVDRGYRLHQPDTVDHLHTIMEKAFPVLSMHRGGAEEVNELEEYVLQLELSHLQLSA